MRERDQRTLVDAISPNGNAAWEYDRFRLRPKLFEKLDLD
jgi:hypothetical protein